MEPSVAAVATIRKCERGEIGVLGITGGLGNAFGVRPAWARRAEPVHDAVPPHDGLWTYHDWHGRTATRGLGTRSRKQARRYRRLA